jgi:two-component system, NtrC family, nitrogen regulation sensor histidine kinase NtrY
VNTKSSEWKRHLWLTLGGVFIAMLVAAVITLGSFNAPLRFEEGNAVLTLFAATIFVVAALLVFGLILIRTLVRLWAERRSGQIGSRFKVKMVLGAMGVSLLPLVFLFFFSYALVSASSRNCERAEPSAAR